MTDGVALAGGPAAPPGAAGSIAAGPTIVDDRLRLDLRAGGTGTAHVFLWDGTTATETQTVKLTVGQTVPIELPLAGITAESGTLLVGFEAAAGGTASLAVSLAG